MDKSPYLSDLVTIWAEDNMWPITIKQSTSFTDLYWVQTIQNIKFGSGHNVVFIGTIVDASANFRPSSLNGCSGEDPNDFINAADPEFFTKLAACIRKVFSSFPQLDSSVLPP
jgi:hypothetical protein